jgi:hypothetical protein
VGRHHHVLSHAADVEVLSAVLGDDDGHDHRAGRQPVGELAALAELGPVAGVGHHHDAVELLVLGAPCHAAGLQELAEIVVGHRLVREAPGVALVHYGVIHVHGDSLPGGSSRVARHLWDP